MKRFFLALIGGTLLLIGLAMVVLPGPAIVVIPAALGILGVEFAWARHSLKWLRERFKVRSSENRPTTESSLKTAHPPVTIRFSTTH
ncbi:MAG: PGPGW domain-containing protein [Chthoniobacteraceae bacterium]